MAPFQENVEPPPVQPIARPLNENRKQQPLLSRLNGQSINPYGGNDCAEQKVEDMYTLMLSSSALNSPHDQKTDNRRSLIYPFFEQPQVSIWNRQRYVSR